VVDSGWQRRQIQGEEPKRAEIRGLCFDCKTGEVDLRLTAAPSKILTLTNSGLGSGAQGDEFGAAVVLADLNDDRCSDIIVGAPGSNGGAGRVHVV
jgi:hypothetical protein